MNILLIEDDDLLGDGLRGVMTRQGFSVDWIRDGLKGRAVLADKDYDMVLLDLNLPGLPGLSILREMRGREDRTPVLVLTARAAVNDRVRALDIGADDYLVKPFDVEELCARIRALHRRSVDRPARRLGIGDLVVDLDSCSVTVKGQPVGLSNREFDILRLLIENRGRVLTRRYLEENVCGWMSDIDSNVVQVHIHHLRKKIGLDLIQTLRGIGYIIENTA